MDPKKRGQVTLFIILAMVIVIILAVTIYVVTRTSSSLGSLEQDQTFVEGQLGGVRAHVSRCVNNQISLTVTELLKNGGKSTLESNSKPYFGTFVNYLLYEGQNKMNLRTEIERKISQAVYDKINDDCSLNAFKDINPKPEKRRLEVQTTLLDDSIKVTAKYPITFRKGKYQTTIEEFKVSSASSFGRLYRLADTIVNQEASGETFNVNQYLLSFPEVKIKRDSQSVQENVYTLTTADETEFLIFATQKK
jgi:hypothetical protein